MPRVFRHNTERGWIELRRTGAGSSQPPARIYPPKQVKERWETPGGLQVLYERELQNDLGKMRMIENLINAKL